MQKLTPERRKDSIEEKELLRRELIKAFGKLNILCYPEDATTSMRYLQETKSVPG